MSSENSLPLLDCLLSMNSENSFTIPDNNRQSKILGETNNQSMKPDPNSRYSIFAKLLETFIPLFEHVIPCSLQNDTIEIIFQT